MDSFRKPMLAGTLSLRERGDALSELPYPLYAQPKLDGIRAWLEGGVLISRNGKPIRNRALQAAVAHMKTRHLPILDGELMPRVDPFGERAFARATESAMSVDGAVEDLAYYVFDVANPSQNTTDRLNTARTVTAALQLALPKLRVVYVEAETVYDTASVLAYEATQLASGAEGVMLRLPSALYKYGRSTFRDAALLKLKRFTDDEATVVGFDEEEANTNEKVAKVTGGIKRSSAAEGKRFKGTLGSLRCSNTKLWPGVTFGVGSGFTAAQRAALWAQRATLTGRTVKFKHQTAGSDTAPRFPTFLGFRDDGDIQHD